MLHARVIWPYVGTVHPHGEWELTGQVDLAPTGDLALALAIPMQHCSLKCNGLI